MSASTSSWCFWKCLPRRRLLSCFFWASNFLMSSAKIVDGKSWSSSQQASSRWSKIGNCSGAAVIGCDRPWSMEIGGNWWRLERLCIRPHHFRCKALVCGGGRMSLSVDFFARLACSLLIACAACVRVPHKTSGCETSAWGWQWRWESSVRAAPRSKTCPRRETSR